jgi:hypothetical protein
MEIVIVTVLKRAEKSNEPDGKPPSSICVGSNSLNIGEAEPVGRAGGINVSRTNVPAPLKSGPTLMRSIVYELECVNM